MHNLLRISEAVSIGLHALVVMAVQPDVRFTAARMADGLKVSRHHLVKVLQRLERAGIVSSERGPAGGYRLLAAPGNVSVLNVIEILEGPVRPASCLLRRPVCGGACLMQRARDLLDRQLVPYLGGLTIARLAAELGARAQASAAVSQKGGARRQCAKRNPDP